MGSLQNIVKCFLTALAFWMMLAARASAQEGDEPLRPMASGSASQPCERCNGQTPPWLAASQNCPNPSRPNLELSPDEWPPTCTSASCDACGEFKSCPQDTDYFAVPPRPCWYIVTDGAAYRRNPPQNVDFVYAPPTVAGGSPSSVLSTREFHYDFAPADHFLVGHTINECYQIEGVYTGITQSSNTASAADPSGQIFSPFSFVSNEPLTFSQATYSTSLNSVELNVRRKIPMPDRLTVSILFGVRYIGLPEDLDFMARPTNTGAAVTDIHVATKNDMIGPQIGTRFELYVDNRWWMNCEVKAALLDNRAQQTTTGTFTGSAGEDHTAFAGDLSLMFVYRWSPHFSTHLGYQALWIQGMAAAPNNLATNNEILRLQPPGVAQLNTFTGTVFQGPVAGLEIGW